MYENYAASFLQSQVFSSFVDSKLASRVCMWVEYANIFTTTFTDVHVIFIAHATRARTVSKLATAPAAVEYAVDAKII